MTLAPDGHWLAVGDRLSTVQLFPFPSGGQQGTYVGRVSIREDPYQLDNRWYANLDVGYFCTSVDVRMRTDEGYLATVTLDAKSVRVSLGFGYKF